MTEYQKVTITMARTKKYPKFNLLTNQWEWTTLLSQTGAKSTKKLYYSVNPGSTGNYTTGTPVQLYIWYYRQTVLFPIDVWHFPVNRINLFVDLLKVPNQTEQQLVYNQYIEDWFSFFLWTITLHSETELSITFTVCLLEVSKSTNTMLSKLRYENHTQIVFWLCRSISFVRLYICLYNAFVSSTKLDIAFPKKT